jgi:hypothetical protein
MAAKAAIHVFLPTTGLSFHDAGHPPRHSGESRHPRLPFNDGAFLQRRPPPPRHGGESHHPLLPSNDGAFLQRRPPPPPSWRRKPPSTPSLQRRGFPSTTPTAPSSWWRKPPSTSSFLRRAFPSTTPATPLRHGGESRHPRLPSNDEAFLQRRPPPPRRGGKSRHPRLLSNDGAFLQRRPPPPIVMAAKAAIHVFLQTTGLSFNNAHRPPSSWRRKPPSTSSFQPENAMNPTINQRQPPPHIHPH